MVLRPRRRDLVYFLYFFFSLRCMYTVHCTLYTYHFFKLFFFIFDLQFYNLQIFICFFHISIVALRQWRIVIHFLPLKFFFFINIFRNCFAILPFIIHFKKFLFFLIYPFSLLLRIESQIARLFQFIFHDPFQPNVQFFFSLMFSSYLA